MMRFLRDGRTIAAVVSGFLSLLGGTADAQQSPQRTTATYDDWTVQCETLAGTPPQKTCRVVQGVRRQSQPNLVTQIAVVRPPKSETSRIIFQVPINVWLPAGVTLVYDSQSSPLAAPFKRCTPAACFADLDISDDTVKKFRTLTERGKLQFKDAAQKDVTVPVSFKGFGQAFDALLKE
jgi:invasion protein IalB